MEKKKEERKRKGEEVEEEAEETVKRRPAQEGLQSAVTPRARWEDAQDTG